LDLELISTVLIGSKLLKKLIRYSEKSKPIEACAVLFGRVQGEEVFAIKSTFLKNLAKSSCRFKIDPIELYNAYLEGEEERLEVVAIFHSHLAIPYPSKTDEHYMGLNPVPWIIVGLEEDQWIIRAYKLIEGKIIPVEIKVEP
jgi:proteasome lid subunit RPN8/RPN11